MVLSACPHALETLPEVQRLPPRLRTMLGILLAHQELLCQSDIGSLELHFHRDQTKDSVKPKLVLHLASSEKE